MINKIKAKMSDGSMDSYHLMGLFYCLCPLLLSFTFLLELFFIKFLIGFSLGKTSLFLELLLFLIFSFLNGCITYYFLKQLKKNFLKKYIIFFFLTLYVGLISFILTLNWICSFFADIYNVLLIFHPSYSPQPIFPYENLQSILELLKISTSNSMIIYIPLSISYMLNLFLPKSLQQKDIPIKKRVIRGIFKMLLLIFLLIVSIVFSKIDKTNFTSITIFTTLFTFMCTPKTILRIFSNYSNIENIKISASINKTFDLYKLLYYEFIFSWSIAIFFFDATDSTTKLVIFAVSLFTLLLLTIITQRLLRKYGTRIFSNWIVPKGNRQYKYRDTKTYYRRKHK
jgi:hypothetical protein